MKLIFSPDDQPQPGNDVIGGKGLALFQLAVAGLPVPAPLCIGTAAYDQFVDYHHLREKIGLELYRKSLQDMRWEEIWDASLRIQHLFLKADLPPAMAETILHGIRETYGDRPLVVRSSAPEEDAADGSFAGLHESYVNVSGGEEIIKKIKMVWASLWSDRAILYRQELGLEILTSKMAVALQPLVKGDVSGILFTRNPLDEEQLVIEAVHGLNQGLVDGAIEPDRWLISRKELDIVGHRKPEIRNKRFVSSSAGGIVSTDLDQRVAATLPLDNRQLSQLTHLGLEVEQFYGAPRDLEWTIDRDGISLLQARPITAEDAKETGDKRAWYLSLTRSYDNLLELWQRISQTLLPRMDQDAAHLAAAKLDELTASEMALELKQRIAINQQWTATYWSDFIPFAHGVRIFGELYNEVMEPEDPYEFVQLLTGQKMLSIERNRLLLECARIVASDQSLSRSVRRGVLEGIGGDDFRSLIDRLRSEFSFDYVGIGDPGAVDQIICAMILQYGNLDSDPGRDAADSRIQLERDFLLKSREKLKMDPAELLQLARASYRIRDDDNIHIGRIGQELERAAGQARNLLQGSGSRIGAGVSPEQLCRLLENEQGNEAAEPAETVPSSSDYQAIQRVRARQLQGQPASRGVAAGPARVIERMADLADFQKGEVMVTDSIDPTMTFFAPLASAIVERRGGMLVHGAIIAREYGIPCITGVVGATELITTGDRVTVDGYLGICTIQAKTKDRS